MRGPTAWILGAIFFVVLAICIAGAVLTIAANDPDVEVNLGDDEFELEDIEGAAERIAESGPDIFPDPTGGNRPILVNHLGGDVEEGWVAVLAIAPDTEACIVSWDADEDVFRDCEGTTYPPDGEGLTSYPTRVDDDTLFVDLGRGRGEPDDGITVTGDG